MASILQTTFSDFFLKKIVLQVSINIIYIDQVMAWQNASDKPLPEPMLSKITATIWCH